MRVLMLSNPDSVHTLKWAQGLGRRGVEVLLMGLQPPRHIDYAGMPGVRLAISGVPVWASLREESSIAKVLYLKGVTHLRRLAHEFRPDVVHAHYISSYGLIGALSGVRPLLISVWGADIYDSPENSWVHRRIVDFSLARADRISATSHAMAAQARKFTRKHVDVVAFGIDMARFAPARAPARAERPFAPTDIVIGTVKTLRPKYGIDLLIDAFTLVRERNPELPLKLLIVGGGQQEQELRERAAAKGVASHTHFTGLIDPGEVPRHHNMLDVYVALSTLDSESFGVAIVEASASEKPVVVSDVGGLPEVVADGVTGLVVPRNDAVAAAAAIERLVLDPALRQRMGAAGRARVRALFDLEHNLDQMIALYEGMGATAP